MLQNHNFFITMIEQLKNSPLFKHIPVLKLEELFYETHYQIKHFPPEAIIAQRKDKCYVLNILLEGSVRGEMYDISGKIIKIEDIHAPEPFASAFIFGDKQTYPVNVVSNSEVKILQIPKSAIINMIQQNTHFLTNYLDMISKRAQLLAEKFWFHNFKTIRQKIANFLLDNCDSSRKTVELKYTQNQLADLFGVTRPSLSRTISQLEKENRIEYRRYEIIIKDKQELKKMAISG